MTMQIKIKNITLALIVIASLFVSGLAIAYDHHDLDNYDLEQCPVCAASHVLSFTVTSSDSPAIVPGSCVISELLPFEATFPDPYVCLKNPRHRGPPAAISA